MASEETLSEEPALNAARLESEEVRAANEPRVPPERDHLGRCLQCGCERLRHAV
jgi:hypothetical protein